MDVTVSGRHCTISDTVRDQVIERISEVERYSDRIQRVEVEFTANDSKGAGDRAIEAEITLRGKGPVVRAEAGAQDKIVAFDKAMERLKTQMRKAADRRKHHRGLRGGQGVAVPPADAPAAVADDESTDTGTSVVAGIEVQGDGPLVVREKEFPGVPLTLAQALDEMELVGHDFFLYSDAETGRPSVVYRRRAYDYGVIHLAVGEAR